GTCTAPQACSLAGVCGGAGCTPESDAAFCTRLGKNCGSVAGTDNCTQPRSVASCGTCVAPQTCSPANICSIPTAGCGNLIVDPGEDCDGGACCTATCTLVAAGTVCRPSAGICDQPESCDGSSGACPTDQFAPAATPCRASAGPCDVAESCTGA